MADPKFPLPIEEKEDHPDKLQLLKSVASKYFYKFSEFKLIIDAINYLGTKWQAIINSNNAIKKGVATWGFDTLADATAYYQNAATDPKPGDNEIIRLDETLDPTNATHFWSFQSDTATYPNNVKKEEEILKSTTDVTDTTGKVMKPSGVYDNITFDFYPFLVKNVGFIQPDGTINTNSSWRYTSLFDIEELGDYYFSLTGSTDGTYLDYAFYGEGGFSEFLGGQSHSDGVAYSKQKMTFPSGTKYVSFSVDNNNASHVINFDVSTIAPILLSRRNLLEKLNSEQAEALIISTSKCNIATDSDIAGDQIYSAPTQKTLGQYYKTTEQLTFNKVEAGFNMATGSFTVEFKVFQAPTKTGVIADMILIQAYTFDESDIPVEDNVLSLDIDESITVTADTYIYVIGFSDTGTLQTSRGTNTDRFLFLDDEELSSFPTSLNFALSDSYGTTGVNLYNSNYLSNKLNEIDVNSKRIEVLENKYIVNKEISFVDELDLINDIDYTIYKSSILRDSSKINESFLYARIVNNTAYRVTKFKTGVDDITFNLDGDYTFNELLLRANDDLTATYSIPVITNSVDYNVKSGQTETWLPIGNSLTNRGVANYTKLFNSAISTGLTINTIGTVTNQGSLLGEGREGWTFLNFIGKSNRHAFTNAVVYSPFMKLADASDKSNHPDWCFERTDSSDELSLAETTDTGQDFYIFDLANYLSVNALTTPTKISIALGTNDLTVYGSGAIDNSNLALDIMLNQIKTALPSVDVAIVSGTVKGDNISSEYRSNQFDLINAIQKKKDDLALSDIKIIPVYAFQNQSFSFEYSSETLLSSNGNYTLKNVLNENIHFRGVGYTPYAQMMLGWILNN